MKTENAGCSRWRTPRNLEWQQHSFFIAAKGSEWKLKIQTQGTNNTLYLPEKTYFFRLGLNKMWSRPSENRKMHWHWTRQILVADKPPSLLSTRQTKKGFRPPKNYHKWCQTRFSVSALSCCLWQHASISLPTNRFWILFIQSLGCQI